MRQESDIASPASREDEEADRASRDLGEQIENARRVLRDYHLSLRRRRLGEDAY
jgi:hypothetical protein